VTPADVRARELRVDLGGAEVLRGVDLAAGRGLTAVLGPNGAGKTTLLRCLATVLPVGAGELTVDGLDPRREMERIEIRRRLGYLPQEVGLVEGSRTFDVVEYLAALKGMRDDRQRRVSVFEVLERVGLRNAADVPVERLSGGMRRRLGLAQALLGDPALLVLDEPAAGLDPDERFRLREIVTERRASCTVVVSTHLTDEAAVCDVVVVLVDGRVRFVGSPAQLAAQAQGRAWVQSGLPPPDVRASWCQVDGTHRCLGTPPPGARLVPPTLEDGYLLVRAGSPGGTEAA
jgi:ABC-2 type transport system ATP-binding protein